VIEPGDAWTERVDAALLRFLDARAGELHTVGAELAPVADAARELLFAGGKRIRPRFAYWGWRCVRPVLEDDADTPALVHAAASLELLHAGALVHDDVMDASATRRGRPAAHVAFAQVHDKGGWHGDASAFGAAAAFLLGDLLLAWSDTLFASATLPGERAGAARRVFDEMRQLVMSGQYLDVLVQARGEFSVDDALRVARFKTSKYTVEGPLHLGAAAAGARAEVFAALSGYGLALGEAFQLRDDVLGVFGDPSRTGKPAGDDLREGKRTLLVALAMRNASRVEAELLRHELGDRDLDDDGVAALREVIVSSGALDAVEARIGERTAEACSALRDAPIAPEARDGLESLARAATERHM
jgi:geranylgeranyl diphosphate synthase type I